MYSQALEAPSFQGKIQSQHGYVADADVSQPSSKKATLSFTQSQLSLALSIQKSRPQGMSTRDYCQQLLRHTKHGKPRVEAEHRYIDTVEFWREHYSKLLSEKKTLEEQLTRIQRRPKSEQDEARPDTLREPGPAGYHVSIAEQQAQHRILTIDADPVPNDQGFINTLPLLKQSLILHQHLGDNKVPADTLLSSIQSCILYMHMAISDICKINIPPGRVDKIATQTIIRTLNTVAAVFSKCLIGLVHLCRDITGRRYKGQAVYVLVHFFKSSLSHLHTLCFQEARRNSSVIDDNGNQADSNINMPTINQKLAPIAFYTKFLAGTLTCSQIQEAHLTHSEVLEGMYAALLEEVGCVVSEAIFGDDHPSSSKPNIVARTGEDNLPSVRALALNLVGQHLTTVLKLAMVGRLDEEGHSLATMLAGPKVSGMDIGKEVLLSRARGRLQETLLKGIFGKDAHAWVNALKIPEATDGWDAELRRVTRDTEDNLIDSVWSVIGWDLILTSRT